MNSCDSDRLIFRSHCHADGGDDEKDHYYDDGGLYTINIGFKVSRPLSAVELKRQIELKSVQISVQSISHQVTSTFLQISSITGVGISDDGFT